MGTHSCIAPMDAAFAGTQLRGANVKIPVWYMASLTVKLQGRVPVSEMWNTVIWTIGKV